MKKICFAFGAALLLTACNSGLGNKKAEAPATTAPAFTLPNTSNSVATATDSGSQPAAGAATAQLNPKHGMPGHRCDIPEGAPLTSTPVQGTVLPGANSAGIPAGPATAAPAAGARVNPPHGQPGHSCDIPVGSPLN